MKVSKDNWEDAKKYFHQTYVKFKEEGDALFFVDRVDPDKIVAKATNGELVGIDLTVGEYHIEYVIPGKAVFQYGPHVVMLSRIPARMWKKGMCTQNTKFETLDATSKWNKATFSSTLIESFINKPCYLEPKEAQKMLGSGEIESAALTPRISLSKEGKLFVDQTIIAKYNGTLFTTKRLFQNEVEKLFPHISVKVVK